MLKGIKYTIWFITKSKEFTGYSYTRMLFKEHLIKRCIWFVKQCLHDDKMKEKYGLNNYYLMQDRILEM